MSVSPNGRPSQAYPPRTTGGIPLYVSPSVRHALEQLGVLLDDYHYSPRARGRILSYAAAHGTRTGCAYLDREDEADATEVFVAELGPVDSDSPAWDREDVFLDVAMLEAGAHPWPIPTFGDDDRDGSFEPGEADWAALRREGDGDVMWGYE
jgi:hypothetical protein